MAIEREMSTPHMLQSVLDMLQQEVGGAVFDLKVNMMTRS